MTVNEKPPVESVGGTVSVKPTSVPEALGVTVAGLNEHSAPCGKLLQLKLTG